MTSTTGFEVAIIAMAGRFPKAENIAEFYELLKNGQEGTRVLTDLELIEAGNCYNLISNENYVKKTASVSGKGYFDADLFNYNPADAASLDPQIAMFHECVWEALESAGYNSETYSGLIGLFAGAAAQVKLPVDAVGDTNSFAENFNNYTLSQPDFLCTRIAHKLNLRGPAVRIESACSTSLVAMHFACQSLIAGECDIALAGGVSIQSLKDTGYLYHPDMILSKEGSCRAFDADASGTMVGEGCGVVVLKMLEDAIEHGDTIIAVVKGSAINNDGKMKVGYTAASVEGQVSVIRAALERAEIPPTSVGYIEAHGTGTKLGDPIEIEALADAYNFSSLEPCAIGAVKTNIGHLGVASGIAGVIKTVLSLQHQCFFPSLHFNSPNPNIDLTGAGLEVSTEFRRWSSSSLPRRAGISSFGIGGTNAHCILEEYDQVFSSSPSRASQVVCLSANTEQSLINNVKNLVQDIKTRWMSADEKTLADICYTLSVGRCELVYRFSCVVNDIAELVAQLEAFLLAPKINFCDPKRREKLCYLFPGQGAQFAGMGKFLYESEEVFRSCIDACLEICAPDVKETLLNCLVSEESAEEVIGQTHIAQPLLFMFESALAMQLAHWGIQSEGMLGHSLGEYVAAHLAGVFCLEDAMRLVLKRAELMQSCKSGGMLSALLTPEEGKQYLRGSIEIAVVNGPDRIVFAGDTSELEDLRLKLDASSVPNSLLRTSHAFHSSFMEPILDEFEFFASGIPTSSPTKQFVSNVTGKWAEPARVQLADYWRFHLRSPVQFGSGVEFLEHNHNWAFVEVGPGEALGKLVSQNANLKKDKKVIASIGGAGASKSCRGSLAVLLSELYCAGISVDWHSYYGNESRRRLDLPTYSFDQKYWYPDHANVPNFADSANDSQVSSEDTHARAERSVVDAKEAITPIEDQRDTNRELLPNAHCTTLHEIWCKHLGRESIGVTEDLFSYGVDSLLSIRVITEIRNQLGVEISLERMFEMSSIQEQANEISVLQNSDARETLPAIARTNHNGRAVLSSSQKRLWIVSLLEQEVSAYNCVLFFKVQDLNISALQKTFEWILQRHAILRTVYMMDEGVPYQQVLEDYTFTLRQLNYAQLSEAERVEKIRELISTDTLRKFDLSEELMIRVTLIQLPDNSHNVMLTQHHITFDNWTTNLLIGELNTVYDALNRGEQPSLPALPVDYIDYAIWQESLLESQAMKNMLAYWKKTLDGIPQVHSLPLDKVRPPQQNTIGGQVNLLVSKETANNLEQFSKAHGATLFMTLQAAFAVFLSRYSGESDIVVGFSVSNRPHIELENVMGIFVNTLVLRSDLSDDPVFLDFLAKTKKNLTSAYANQAFPFERLVEALNPERSLSYEPLVQIHLTILNQDLGHESDWYSADNGRTFTPLPGDLPYSKFDLTLYVSITPDGITTSWEYPCSLFERETIERMAVNFSVLLDSIVNNPSLPASKLPLYSEREREQLLFDFNLRSYPGGIKPALPMPVQESELPHDGNCTEKLKFSLFYFANDTGGRTADKYQLLLEGAKYADANFFEAVWTPERHFDTFGGLYPNPAITSAAIASVTNRIKIRAGSCVLPLHSPIRLAEDWSVIDNMSGGRVGIGIAAGFHPKDFTIAPASYESRQTSLFDQVEIIRQLWRGDSIALKNGLGEMESVNIRPLPIQAELPIWLTTTGNIESFKRAGTMGINLLTHLMGQTAAELRDKISAYRAAWRNAGHRGRGSVSVLIHTFVSSDQNYVYSMVKEPFKAYLKESIGSPQFLQKHLGVAASSESQSDDMEVLIERAFSRYYKTSALLGTPQSCKPIVDELQLAGVDEIACLIDFGIEDQIVYENLTHLNTLRELVQLKETKATSDIPIVGSAKNSTKTWVEIFEAQAAATPHAIAVKCRDQVLDYAELEQITSSIAKKLRRRKIERDSIVALLDHRDIDLVIMMISVLRAGAAFLPIDPTHPSHRWCDILEEAQPDLAILGHRLSNERSTVEGSIEIKRLLSFGELLSEPEANECLNFPKSDDLAYVIYTSGSTGKPKGAMVEHFGMLNNMHTKLDPLETTSADVIAQTASQCFDVSVFQFLGAVTFGGSVVIVPHASVIDPERFLQYLDHHQVSIWVVVPSVLHALLPFKQPLPRLRCLHSTGEAFPPSLTDRWFAQYPGIPIYNDYGPAECSDTVAFDIISEPCEKVFIGNAAPNVRLYIVDENLSLVPMGAVGELAVSGAILGRGYLNRPDLTEAAFVQNPYAVDESDRRLYLTGDLVRRHNDGRLEYLGRKDFQVKIRGFRIELGEIEKNILKYPGVAQAVVHPVDSGELGKQLVAYLVADDAVSWDGLRVFLRERLPDYMVPAICIKLDAFPLSENGKVARRRLPVPDEKVWRRNEYVAPEGRIETVLANIWQDVLGVGSVGRYDNFFDLGGNSLLAISMLSRLKACDIQLSINEIYQNPVLVDCCEGLVRASREIGDWLSSADIDFRELQLEIEGKPVHIVLINKIYQSRFFDLRRSNEFGCEKYPAFIRFTDSLDDAVQDLQRNGLASLPRNEKSTQYASFVQLDATLKKYEEDLLALEIVSQFPLSPMQKEWLMWDAREGVEWMVFNGAYSAEELQRASQKFFNRHDLLHAWLDKNAILWNEMRTDCSEITIPVLNVELASQSEKDELLQEVIETLLKTCKKSYLNYAAVWVSVSDTEHHFIMAADHLVTDGASATIIEQGLQQLLDQEAGPLPVNYRDYVAQVWSGATNDAFEIADSLLNFTEIVRLRTLVSQRGELRKAFDFMHLQLEVPFVDKFHMAEEAFEIFKRIVSYLFDLDQFVMTLNQYGRKLGQKTYYDQVGLFLDKIPMVVSTSTTLAEVSGKVEQLVNNNLNFLALKQSGFDACRAAAPKLTEEIVFNFVMQSLTAQTEIIVSKVNMKEVLRDFEGILFEAYPSANGLVIQLAFKGQQDEAAYLKDLLGANDFSVTRLLSERHSSEPTPA